MSENLRLERIRVNKLFNRFNYDIDLNNGFDVGILIAPNGCGKTTIFNLIELIFNPSLQGYRTIVNVPFDFCECTLSNGKVVTLERHTYPIKKVVQGKDFNARIESRKELLKRSKIDKILGNRTGEDVRFGFRIDSNDKKEKGWPGDFTLLFYNAISGLINDESFPIDDLSENMDNMPSRILCSRVKNYATRFIREYLETFNCNLNINYIRADRCYRPHESIENSSKINRNPLSEIQDSILKFYDKTINKYNNLLQKMKDNLPKMYLDMKDEKAISFTDFQQGWNKYLSDIKKYCEIDLLLPLPPEEQQTLQKILEVDKKTFENKKAFLTVYLRAFAEEATLKPLEEFYSRLKLFADILNHRNRVTRKVVKYDFCSLIQQGIVFEVDGKQLPLESLSSGEKNDLIMFYHLIFDSYDPEKKTNNPAKKIDLVLVDEPEISLHISWQRKYLDHLLEICKINKLQAFVATHSPNIINGHIEMYVKKGATNETTRN